jgi:hypothetical protein
VQATCACPQSALLRGDLARAFLGSGWIVGQLEIGILFNSHPWPLQPPAPHPLSPARSVKRQRVPAGASAGRLFLSRGSGFRGGARRGSVRLIPARSSSPLFGGVRDVQSAPFQNLTYGVNGNFLLVVSDLVAIADQHTGLAMSGRGCWELSVELYCVKR